MIAKNLIPILSWLSNSYLNGGKIMTLGRQTVGFKKVDLASFEENTFEREVVLENSGEELTQEQIFYALGFDEVHSLDVSNFEGSTHIFDLNSRELPAGLRQKYDLVKNGGTLEHVFDFSQGLRNALQMIRPNGFFLHFGPVNNWVDHGFFQFSPTLWFDFFEANNFEILVSASIELTTDSSGAGMYKVRAIKPGEGVSLNMKTERVVQMVLARAPASHEQTMNIPKQDTYTVMHGEESEKSEIPTLLPFDVVDGQKTNLRLNKQPIAPESISRLENSVSTYFIDVTKLNASHELKHRPYKSPFMIFQNGEVLAFQVAKFGTSLDDKPGRFCHRGSKVYFSPTLGVDPKCSSNKYELAIF